ncbi:hypothetical protein ACFWBB_30960 [Streptomyces sp. NPDC060000]|uniref:hypothetical protein n=1 Tax=Streptomyces sp. NPDC060000 TaxID=3347031 RepID=UPI0036954099
MSENTPMEPRDLDDELEWLRHDAAALRGPLELTGTTSDQVKALEARAAAGEEFAGRFAQFDAAATAGRDAPRAWRRGQDVSHEMVPAWLEEYPGTAEALGTTWVQSLAAVGLTPPQMAALVRQVQGVRELPEIEPGDIVEGIVAGNGPAHTVRVQVDRVPWPSGPDTAVLCDRTGATAVLTSSVRVVLVDEG